MSTTYQYRRTKNEQAGESSSTTTVRKVPANSSVLRRYQLEQLKQLHQECFGRAMPAPIAAEVLRDLDAQTPSKYYRYAMMEACYAPRPSWRYVQAIVRRCKDQMVNPDELEGC